MKNAPLRVRVTRIYWSRHSEPPDGLPRVLAHQCQIIREGHSDPATEIETLYVQRPPPRGYWLGVLVIRPQRRRLSPAARAGFFMSGGTP